MARHIDHHSTSEDKHVLFPVKNVHAISIGEREEFHGNFGNRFGAARERLSVVGEIALRLEGRCSSFFDLKRGVEEGKKLLADRGPELSSFVDLVVLA